MRAGTGVGIAALVLCIIGAVTPGVGLYVGWVALIVACFAALLGDKGLTIATVIVSALIFIFLTPSLWVAEGMRAIAMESGAPKEVTGRVGIPVSIALLIAPIVCMFLHGTGKLALRTRKT